MSKHTPGNWVVRYAKKSTDLPYEIFSADSLEFKVTPLACVSSNGPNNEHYDANARLIATAPEMLKALKLIKAKYEMSRGDFSVNRLKDEDNVKAMSSFIENLDFVTGHINDAIAKAEGSSND